MATSFIRKILTAVDYYTGRYECSVAEGALADECFAIRERVFGAELKRKKTGAPSPGEKDEYDAASVQIACMDVRKGISVGSVRVTPITAFSDHPAYVAEYGLKHIPSDLRARTCVVTRLAVLKEHRRSPAAVLLAMKAYKHVVMRMNMALSIMVCEPNLYPMYRRLGYRPLDRIINSELGGYRLPLVIVLHDYAHLKAVGSPFLKIAAANRFPVVAEGLAWLASFTKDHPCVDTGYRLLSDEDAADLQSVLVDRLSRKGRAELIKNAVTMTCEVGDKIIARGDGGKNLGFVVKGALEVRRGGDLMAVLGQGEVFGEIAFLLDVPRTADVIAAVPKTEVTLVSLSAIARLSRAEDRAQIWQNLARLLARRLAGPQT